MRNFSGPVDHRPRVPGRARTGLPSLMAISVLAFAPVSCSQREESPPAVTPSAVLNAVSPVAGLRIVDLTHPFAPGIPHREALGDEIVEHLFAYAPGKGSMGTGAQLDRYSLIGQWGTHVDAPVHFGQGMRSLDQITPREMILPLVVLDIHVQAASDPDYVVSMKDVRAWEARHGTVPTGAFVALRSDWSKRWSDPAAYFNIDAKGVSHYPGWSREVLEYLDENRQVTAIGHETPDTDPGIVASSSNFPLEAWHLKQDRYQIENLANLDQVPEFGAIVIATWPNAKDASGFPARVLALVP